jgi:hypothetical protein
MTAWIRRSVSTAPPAPARPREMVAQGANRIDNYRDGALDE